MKKHLLAALAVTIIISSLAGWRDVKAQEKTNRKAFIVSHFHCDPVWTNTQAGEILRSLSVVHQQLEYAAMEPKFKFILSEIDYLKPYWDIYPWQREQILSLAKEGRVEFTGGYCEPDEAEVGGEALLRNFAYGKIYKEAFFNTEVVTAAQHDVFGHAVQLPQILLGTGHRYAQFSRGNLTDLPMEFRWLSPDGSSILTKSIGYGGSASDASFFARDKSFYGLTRNAMFMSGGDFNEPDRSIGFRLKNTKNYDILSGTHRDFFEAVEKELKDRKIVAPEVSRDHTPLLVGCYTSRIDTKWANRVIENLLIEAEKFSTINSLISGAPYPWLELDKAWRMLLFGQHHDALTGSDNENVNLDLLSGWREAAHLAKNAIDNSLAGIAEQVDTSAGGGSPLVVFNPLNWDRSDPVETEITFTAPVDAFKINDSSGKPVPFQLSLPDAKPPYSKVKVIIAPPDIPSIGYSVLYVSPADKFPEGAVPTREKATAAENDFYKIVLDPARGGGIKSLFSKKQNREFIDSSVGVGNEIFSIKENAEKVEAPWSIHATGQYWRSGAYPAKEITLERGAVRDRLIVVNEPHVEKAKIYNGADKVVAERDEEVLPELVQEIILYKNSPRIDFNTDMNNFKAQDLLFKVGFPAALPGTVPVFEERFASISRERNTEDFLFYDFWREPGVKRGREYPAYNWIDLSPFTSLNFTDSGGGIVSQFPLLAGEIVTPDSKAVKEIANDLAKDLVKAGVTTTPTADITPRTNEYYGFRISLDAGGKNVYTKKMLDSLDPARKKQFEAEIESAGAAFLFIENPDSVTSTPDARPIPILLISAKSETELSAAMDKISAGLDENKNISLPASANLTSFKDKQSGFGMALINNGNPGNSVERNNTMTLTLMRSITGWPAGRGYTENWETQHWNHRFRYALLPHEKDWLSAGVARSGYEFNNPLRAAATGIHGGSLPADRHLFFTIENADTIVSALKPAGYSVIDGKEVSAEPRAVSIRLYNPGDTKTSGTIASAFPIAGARAADMLDNPGDPLETKNNSVPFSLGPYKIGTYLLYVNSKNNFLLPTAAADETRPPHYVRYWETNENIAPEGFMPVSVILEENGWSADRTALSLRVTVSNNMLEGRAAGNIELSLPEGAESGGALSYDLSPGEYKTFVAEVKSLDSEKMSKQFISAIVSKYSRSYEDVLHFNNWKVFSGDLENGAAPETDDSAWETLPLARFWSRGVKNSGTTWYRRRFFVPQGMGDVQMTFERPDTGKIQVYFNGKEVRTESRGTQYAPLVPTEALRRGEENLIAIKYTDEKTDAPAWCNAFMGSEALFNKDAVRLSSDKLSLEPGERGTIGVTFRNPFDQPVEGVAVLASPIETWAEGDTYSLISTTPYSRNFKAAPGGEAAINFDVEIPAGAMPGVHVAAVKLIYKGMVSYTDTVHITVE